MSDMPEFRYRGARALMILQEKELRLFVDTWKKAKEVGVTLPPTKNPDYESFDQILHHVVFRARDIMLWICKSLELPEPPFDPVPGAAELEHRVDGYLDRLLLQMRTPLTGVPGRDFYFKTYTSAWRTDYCLDAMLEHLVIHPMRHRFQLEELMQNKEE